MLTLYHDIGYEYYSLNITVDKINKEFAEYFTLQNPIFKEYALSDLCIENDLSTLNYNDGLSKLVEKSMRSNEIYDIWSKDTDNSLQLLYSIIDIDYFPTDIKPNHSYYSALLLTKTLQTKEIIRNYYHEILSTYKDDDKFEKEFLKNRHDEELFRSIIKPIFLHDFKNMKNLTGHLLSMKNPGASSWVSKISP
jgi:hypothetical protein